jgi:hypothetical protein
MDGEYTEQLAFFYQMASPAFILKHCSRSFSDKFQAPSPVQVYVIRTRNSTATLILSVHTPNCSWFDEFQASLWCGNLVLLSISLAHVE